MTISTMPLRRVAVFCGSADGNNPAFRAEATALGTGIAKAGLVLVYGGTSRGLMGAVADAALAHGGEVIGVLPDALNGHEIAHRGPVSLEIVPTMHDRKARIHELADAFLVLPGGFGTLDELLETITWAQIGLHAKPIILVSTANYWYGLIAFLHSAVAAGFIEARNMSLLRVVPSAEDALLLLASRLPESDIVRPAV
ncbi:MAG: TIGR00730 family Rossman fold protein [Terracidiphilus sp.]